MILFFFPIPFSNLQPLQNPKGYWCETQFFLPSLKMIWYCHCYYLSASVAFLICCCCSAANGVSYSTVIVDPSGHGQFSTIQSAINSVPVNNNRWVHVYVKAGQYREQVHISYDRPYIYIQGEGMQRTEVIWDSHDSIATSATFTSLAGNIVVVGITFVNSYNYPPEMNKNPVVPALAAMISGDKSAFYGCGFLGLQDTVWDVEGRHYFKYCTIQGAVDFIFGAGQSIYHECTLSVTAEALHGRLGYVTAQGRSSADDTSGFVFKNCNLIGNGKTFLGRPWRGYARVLFYNSSMSDIIVPEGWDPWNSAVHERKEVVFAEHGCFGKGSDTSGRVGWVSKLSTEMVSQLTSISFVDDNGWISNQPYHST